MDSRGGRVVALAVACVLIAAACASSTSSTPSTPSTSSTAVGPGTSGAAGGTTGGSASGSASGTAPSGTVVDAGYRSVVYGDPKHWLCGPDGSLDVCARPLDTTEIAPDGTTTVQPFVPATDPPIDCFYVYPTISADQAPNSDLEVGAPEITVTLSQAARLGSVCKVYAPVYRQNTIASLMGTIQSDVPLEERYRIAYADVADAWRHYLATANHGRGVVLIGHSQGAGMLKQLVQEEIDDRPEQRDLLVSALLIGNALRVPEGEDVGGDFDHVPLCRAATQLGCAVSWSSFRSTAPPPPDSYFGKPREGDGVSACVSPSALVGHGDALHAYWPTPGRKEQLGSIEVTTPFITMPGLVTGECVVEGGFSFLKVTVHGDPADPRPDDIAGDLTPPWGLHLVDVNLEMGDVVDLVRAEAGAWTSAH